MRAVVIAQPGSISLDTLPDPTPAPGEVVVAVDSCGVCGTDLHVLDGEYPVSRFPLVPGHEFAGTVVAVGAEVHDLAEGDFVAVDPVIACGYCEDCREGWGNLCRNWRGYGVAVNGGFADYAAVRATCCQRLPASLPRHWGGLVEPLSCVLHALDRLGRIRPAESVLVIGAGPSGLLLSQLLSAAGGLVDVLERVPQRRERALAYGARRVADDVADLDQPGGWQVVVEATGSAGGVRTALRNVRRAGRVHIYGVATPDTTVPLSPYEMFDKELTITGSQSLRLTFGRAARVLASGLVDAEGLITHRIPLAGFATALANVRTGAGLKTQLVPSG